MGIAKLRYSAHDPTTSTQVVGTYPYMAPEMFEGSKSGTAVDIYSFGCILIKLFSERRVWPGLHTSAEIMHKVCGSFNSQPTMPETNDLPLLRICYNLSSMLPTEAPRQNKYRYCSTETRWHNICLRIHNTCFLFTEFIHINLNVLPSYTFVYCNISHKYK